MKNLPKYPKQHQIQEQFFDFQINKINSVFGRNIAIAVTNKEELYYRVTYVWNEIYDLGKLKFEKIGYVLEDGTFTNKKQ